MDVDGEVLPPPETMAQRKARLRFAVVCSSNQNRSMEGHLQLSKQGFNINSYGTGQCVKLPGPTADRPNIYEFGAETYAEMYDDLLRKDRLLYDQNGLLEMLDRNKKIKPKPERFPGCSRKFDVILTVEGRVFDQVVQALLEEGSQTMEVVHVFNLEVKDNHESAKVAALQLVDLADAIVKSKDFENEVDSIISTFEAEFSETLLHSVCFY
eukprot:m.128375 g.128375  ORF g.128375 m.128375 type:complete len:211 (+) comp19893_c0_seq4:1823-2455(+)